MNKILEKARQQHRKAIEMLYEDSCNIIEYQSVKDPVTKQTSKKEVIVLENQPCNLSYSTTRNATSTEAATIITQTPLLFISSVTNIKAGSKIVVTKKENKVIADSVKTTAYKNSGVPAVYSGHQEITLELFKGWS
jgi:hypothetical protein